MPKQPLGRVEFIALIAMLFATIAFSIDAMLPALPRIAQELSPDAPNSAQLILTAFVLGMGLGTLFAGPLSDSFGRKPVIVLGAALYVTGAVLGYFADNLTLMLAARVLQGIGAAGPRVVSLALVRDLFKGREMAQIMSFAMMVFSAFPAIAPLIGQVIIAGFGWRAIFIAFVGFSILSITWFGLRQPETLPPPARRPFSPRGLWESLVEVTGNRIVQHAIVVQSLCFAVLFATLSSTQPIFDETFGRAESFPLWFALIASFSALSSFINSKLVMRIGMRRVVMVVLVLEAGLTALFIAEQMIEVMPADLRFAFYLIWTTGIFMAGGLTLGNLNAIAMEPLGHVAGMAASVIGSVATVISVAIAAPIGLAFDGTPLPLAVSVIVLTVLAALLMRLRMPVPPNPAQSQKHP